MATLVFTSLGTALGGPLGGLAGGLIGRQVDAALLGGSGRTGPRLDDLRISSSSYGSAIPRHFGRVRAPGSIIWSTDLVEHAETTGSVTAYRYSISFAIALASAPIEGIGRIWADGNLLRGADGALKTGGALRIHSGYGDQPVDTLLASALGNEAPAHRGIAYAVFQDLDLSGFGNRIPSLSFEILGANDASDLGAMLPALTAPAAIDVPLPGLSGFTWENGPISNVLAMIDAVYPLACNAGGDALTVTPAERIPAAPMVLPEPARATAEDSFGPLGGTLARRILSDQDRPQALRYFDPDRDYLAGMQRAGGRPRPGREQVLDFPGTIEAENARSIVDAAAERAAWSSEIIAWRIAELDPSLAPGNIVRVPEMAGLWRIISWEWRNEGIELELLRLPPANARRISSDAGRIAPLADLPASPTQFMISELPWDGTGRADEPAIAAAISSTGSGWAGAGLHVDRDGMLVPLRGSGGRRSIIGELASPLAPSAAMLLERAGEVTVALIAADLTLSSVYQAALASGANRALIGAEILQFETALPLGDGRWRLTGLLRGRSGTEGAAQRGHPAGTPFMLLDDSLRTLDPRVVGDAAGAAIGAQGLGDEDLIFSPIANPGLSLRPLCPVHPGKRITDAGDVVLHWVRRARGAWAWRDQVETPLVEETENYLVGLGSPDRPLAQWVAAVPRIVFSADEFASLAATYPGMTIWVCQIGTHSRSDPLRLTILP